ncbi:MAG TPA: heterocyst differentiation protein HetZ [Oscillatoriales cyanobacterium M59_W2019_021]|nr:heterocyst differentiation protein HetZ [Oscillatoriales cyanobacterium M4454_W2019_049]HIK53097.1 heterocyst differentiation protein HetZ [Oscillatoriales cyanobacterium M59_W2019_021]
MEAIFQLLFNELRQSTRASESNCRDVAERLTAEVERTCAQSDRIQASGKMDVWATKLARHRLKQCLDYYKLGSVGGRVELHSTLSAIVYRYIAPPQGQLSYQARLHYIEDFLQIFYAEALNALRREAMLSATFSPRTLLEVAEYMAFTERYAKRRIGLPGGRSQQLVILRAQTFSKQQPPETSIDMDRAVEGTTPDPETNRQDPSTGQVREQIVDREPDLGSDLLRETVIRELIAYLEDNNQRECVDYFVLRLQDLQTHEIEEILGLTPRQRDYLQQRFRYHLTRFALSHHWELVHQWLDVDLDRNLGLTPQQWDDFLASLSAESVELLNLKRQKMTDSEIARRLGCSLSQANKQWFKLLKQVWEIRNQPE